MDAVSTALHRALPASHWISNIASSESVHKQPSRHFVYAIALFCTAAQERKDSMPDSSKLSHAVFRKYKHLHLPVGFKAWVIFAIRKQGRDG